MRQAILISVLISLICWAPAARSKVGGLQLEICRMPGLPAEDSGDIRLPAGTVFTDARSDGDVAPSPGAAPPVQVILAAPATIGAAAFCVRAPARLPDAAAGAALRAEPDRMFWMSAGPAGSLDQVYALLHGVGAEEP